MKIAVRLNDKNIIQGYVYIINENYTGFEDLKIIEVEDIANIIPYKTKYELGQLTYLDDFCDEYYTQRNAELHKIELQAQLDELYAWFDEYDNQIKQYERDIRLGLIGTYHIGGVEYTIVELDLMAKEQAREISALREQISKA